MNSQILLSEEQIRTEQASFISKVYAWMCLALVITAGIAMFVASSEELISLLFSSKLVFFGLIIVQFLLVAWLTTAVAGMSAFMATYVFLIYSAINGITFSVIFVIFTPESIASTFFVTAGTFAVMSAYGYFTKKDLTTLRNLFLMGLVGLIIASVVNWFLKSEMLYWITTYVGVLIFVGLIAFDTQKIKNMNVIGNEGTDEDRKEAIMGALILYLDFINLFLYLLRIFGRKK